MLIEQAEQGRPGTDFDVVAVGAEAGDAQRTVGQAERVHVPLTT